MVSAIKEISYLLYDNRTRASWGHDWGLKMATGPLADEPEIRQRFVVYCSLSFDTGAGLPSKFGYAVGGFPAPAGRGYVLCVTLESLDHHDRHSCSVVGLWFPGITELQWFLEYHDAEATARVALAQVPPPQRLRPVPGDGPQTESAALRQTWARHRAESRLLVELFENDDTPTMVIALLRDLIRSHMTLPAVLGITSAFRPSELESAGFWAAFCLPASARARMAVDQYRSSQEVGRDRDRATASLSQPARTDGQGAEPAGSPGGWRTAIVLLMVLVATTIATLLLLGGKGDENANLAERVTPTEAPSSQPPQAPTELFSAPDDDIGFLAEIDHLTQQLVSMSPQNLRETRAFRLLEDVDVVPEHAADRLALVGDLERLAALRERLIGSSGNALNLRYYFENRAGTGLSTSRKAEEISKHLQAAQLPVDPCQRLRAQLLFEFKLENGVLAEWCTCLDRIARLTGSGSGS